MHILIEKTTSLCQAVHDFLLTRPSITDLYLYNVDKEELATLSVPCHDLTQSFEETVSHLSLENTRSRLLISKVTLVDLERFKNSYISAYFYEACFISSLNWDCLFIDWSAGMSTEQSDQRGVFRAASLPSSLPTACTLTIPILSVNEKVTFQLESGFCQKIQARCYQSKVSLENGNHYSILLRPYIKQYYLRFDYRLKLMDKIFKKASPVYFIIRNLVSKHHGPSKDHNPLTMLKQIHALGYYSATSYFNSTILQTKFTYFEQGFKVVSITDDLMEEIHPKELAMIFATKYALS